MLHCSERLVVSTRCTQRQYVTTMSSLTNHYMSSALCHHCSQCNAAVSEGPIGNPQKRSGVALSDGQSASRTEA